MPLTIGARVGGYDVVAPLGAGGMGEVFRARDARLKRDVAPKVLPATAVADPDRRARFEREAQVLAALDHPNLAVVFGVEEADGAPVIVRMLKKVSMDGGAPVNIAPAPILRGDAWGDDDTGLFTPTHGDPVVRSHRYRSGTSRAAAGNSRPMDGPRATCGGSISPATRRRSSRAASTATRRCGRGTARRSCI